MNIEVKSKAKTRYLRPVEYINSIVLILDIKKFYIDLKPQPITFRELNHIKSAINDSKGKEKTSFHNISLEHDFSEAGIIKNHQQNLIKKKRIKKKSLIMFHLKKIIKSVVVLLKRA